MGENVQARTVFDPPSSHLSYVVSITLPQPTIRIRIPKMLVKAIQKRKQTRTGNEENGSKTRKKNNQARMSFSKKVGSMFSNVFGKKKSPETNSKGGNGEPDSNGEDDGMENLRKMVERLDMESEKTTGKSTLEDFILHDGVQEMAAVATNERKERPKSRRTLFRRNDLELMNTGRINYVDDSGIVVTNANGDMGAIVSLKQAEIWSDNLPRFRLSSPRKPKIAWSMKKMNGVLVGGRSGRHELCKKRILMGVKCRPLNDYGIVRYDENGVVLPDFIP